MTTITHAAPSSIFTVDEFGPTTGKPHADASMETIVRVAEALARYDEIRIETDRHRQIERHYDMVMACGAATPGRPQRGGRILGPSGSGKTTAARHYQKTVEARGLHQPGERPVLIVPLDRACTSRRFFSSILRAVGDGFYERGTEELLQKRAYEALRRFAVRLLIVDETQHLAFRSTERNDTTDTLKRVLDDSICPAVLIGTDAARDFLNENVQLANRLHAPCDLPPLDGGTPKDRKIFKSYVKLLDQALVEADLVRGSSGLTDKRTLSCLLSISDGVLGRVSNLVRVALAEAVARDADVVEICDLSLATSTWAISQNLIDYDPFRVGVRRNMMPKPASGL